MFLKLYHCFRITFSFSSALCVSKEASDGKCIEMIGGGCHPPAIIVIQ